MIDLVFQGPLVRFELAAPDGSALVAHVGPDEELPLLRPGDAVRVVWDADGGTPAPPERTDRAGPDRRDRELS